MADSVALSREQLDRIEVRRRAYRARADSIYRELGAHLAGLPEEYDTKEAVKHTESVIGAIWQMNYNERPFLNELLTPGQIRLLPTGLYMLVTDRNFRGRFVLR